MQSNHLEIRIGYAASAAGHTSGDMAVSCSLPDGTCALILSDGMGKGEQAAAESRRLVRRLRKNLKNGMSPVRAIREVNRFMIQPESFATMDLALLDRQQGQVKFYKMGAAYSFLLRSGHVRRIAQRALPIGILPSLRLNRRTFNLEEGDILVMVSDGITEADRKDLQADWISKILIETANAQLTPRRLARLVLQEAQKRCGEQERDDQTVAAVFIEKAE